MSSSDVKRVTETVTASVAQLKARATSINDDLRSTISEVNESLDLAEELSKSVKQASADLRAALGQTTNHPPPAEKIS